MAVFLACSLSRTIERRDELIAGDLSKGPGVSVVRVSNLSFLSVNRVDRGVEP